MQGSIDQVKALVSSPQVSTRFDGRCANVWLKVLTSQDCGPGKVCVRREDKKGVCSWTTGPQSGGHLCSPESTRAPASGRFRMAAALRKQAAGRPGSRQRGKTAGSGPEACERKRIELWPIRGPPERQQDRLQASRGSCGRANDIGPGGSRSGRPYHRQVKSLALEVRQKAFLVAQGCDATNAIEAAQKEENLHGALPARSGKTPVDWEKKRSCPEESGSDGPVVLLGSFGLGTQAMTSSIFQKQFTPLTPVAALWSRTADRGDDSWLGSRRRACVIQRQPKSVNTTHRVTDGREWKAALHAASCGHHELVFHLCHAASV